MSGVRKAADAQKTRAGIGPERQCEISQKFLAIPTLRPSSAFGVATRDPSALLRTANKRNAIARDGDR